MMSVFVGVNACPVCRSQQVYSGPALHSEEGAKVEQQKTCLTCRYSWKAVYLFDKWVGQDGVDSLAIEEGSDDGQ